MKHFGRKFDFDQGTSVVLKECRRWLPLVSWVADCGKSGTIEKSDGVWRWSQKIREGCYRLVADGAEGPRRGGVGAGL